MFVGATGPVNAASNRSQTAAQFTMQSRPTAPAGFDPLTASASDLQRYGIPPKPEKGSPGYASWVNDMLHLKHINPVQNVQVALLPKSSASCSYGTPSQNWAGVVAQEYYAPWQSNSANWSVPALTGSQVSGSRSADWVGIGIGCDIYDALAQAGTEQDGPNSPMPGSAYHIWLELYPQESQLAVLSSYLPNPGDQMYVSVTYNPSSSSAVDFYFEDLTQGWSWSPSPSSDYSSYITPTGTIDQSTAEWIHERPTVCNSGATQIPHLAQTTNASFTNESAMDSSGASWAPGQLATTQVTMVDNTGTVASLSGVGYSSTDIQWDSPGAILSTGQSC